MKKMNLKNLLNLGLGILIIIGAGKASFLAETLIK